MVVCLVLLVKLQVVVERVDDFDLFVLRQIFKFGVVVGIIFVDQFGMEFGYVGYLYEYG